jgi:hypothetical protein
MPAVEPNEPVWRPTFDLGVLANRASRRIRVLFLQVHPTFWRLRRMLASGGETRWTNRVVVSGTSLEREPRRAAG